jgi:hypothetical protein
VQIAQSDNFFAAADSPAGLICLWPATSKPRQQNSTKPENLPHIITAYSWHQLLKSINPSTTPSR